MPGTLSTFERATWLCTIALPALVIWRLFVAKLWAVRPYHGLCIMFAVDIVRDVMLWSISYDLTVYARAWEVSLIALLTAQVYACIVTYDQLARRRTMDFAAAVAVAALLCAYIGLFESDLVNTELRTVIMLERWIDGSLAVLLVAAALQRHWRAPAHLWILACYFAEHGVVCLVKNLMPVQWPPLGPIHSLALSALYVAWLYLLPNAPETRSRAARMAQTLHASSLAGASKMRESRTSSI